MYLLFLWLGTCETMFMYDFKFYSFQDCLFKVCDRLHIEYYYSAQQQENADTIGHENTNLWLDFHASTLNIIYHIIRFLKF